MAILSELLKELEEFNRSPDSVGYDLRLDLAQLVLEELRIKGWKKSDLARKAAMKPSFMTRIVNSRSNCTFDVAGRICHALGIKPKLVRASETLAATQVDKQNGKTQIVFEGATGSASYRDRVLFCGPCRALRHNAKTRQSYTATSVG